MNDRDLRRVGKAEKALINSMARKVRKTRADRIRASTDDELAEMLCLIAGGLGPVHTAEHKCWLDWLKQEATFNAKTTNNANRSD